MPSCSSSFKRSESNRSERSGTHSLISEKRAGPSSRTNRIAPVHRLPTSSTAWWYWEQQVQRVVCAGVATAETSPMREIVVLGGIEQAGILHGAVRGDV